MINKFLSTLTVCLLILTGCSFETVQEEVQVVNKLRKTKSILLYTGLMQLSGGIPIIILMKK